MKRWIFPAGLIVLVLLFVLIIPCKTCLSLSCRKNPSDRYFFLNASDGFVINYTHSVNKGRIHDYYRPYKNGMLLYKTEFVSYGAGIPEPYESSNAVFSSTDSGFVVSNLDRYLKKFVMAIGLIAEHTITAGNNEYLLTDFFPAQTSIIIEYKKISILEYFCSRNKIVQKS